MTINRETQCFCQKTLPCHTNSTSSKLLIPGTTLETLEGTEADLDPESLTQAASALAQAQPIVRPARR